MQKAYEKENYGRDYQEPSHTPPWEREERQAQPRREMRDEYDYDAPPRPRARPAPRVERDEVEINATRKPSKKSQGFSLMGYIYARPFEAVAFGASGLLAMGVMANALFFQNKPHIQAVKSPEMVIAQKPIAPDTRFTTAPLPTPTFQAPVTRTRAMMVEEAQRELSRRGLYKDEIDGKTGSRTEKAVKDFQRATGLKATGEITEELIAMMRPSAHNPRVALNTQLPNRSAMSDLIETLPQKADPMVTASTTPTVRRIYNVEKALAEMAYGPLTVDGIFGEDTKAAILKFEQARNIRPTGQINDRLMKELAAVTGYPIE